MVCESLSLSHICKNCQIEFLSPSLYKRKILGKIPVYSFYKYKEIESLLLSKHTDLGYYIYTILATNSFSTFAKNFEYEAQVASIGIDDHVRNGYSHTAILNKHLKSQNIRPRYARLKAQSPLSYSGKDYQYRLLHPRNFKVSAFKEEEVILVDDVITSGLTLTQAAEALHAKGKTVILCLTLADAGK